MGDNNGAGATRSFATRLAGNNGAGAMRFLATTFGPRMDRNIFEKHVAMMAAFEFARHTPSTCFVFFSFGIWVCTCTVCVYVFTQHVFYTLYMCTHSCMLNFIMQL